MELNKNLSYHLPSYPNKHSIEIHLKDSRNPQNKYPNQTACLIYLCFLQLHKEYADSKYLLQIHYNHPFQTIV